MICPNCNNVFFLAEKREDPVASLRVPVTVRMLKEIVADLDDDMPVRVSHQPLYQLVGMQCPVVRPQMCYTIVDITERGAPMYGDPIMELVIE